MPSPQVGPRQPALLTLSQRMEFLRAAHRTSQGTNLIRTTPTQSNIPALQQSISPPIIPIIQLSPGGQSLKDFFENYQSPDGSSSKFPLQHIPGMGYFFDSKARSSSDLRALVSSRPSSATPSTDSGLEADSRPSSATSTTPSIDSGLGLGLGSRPTSAGSRAEEPNGFPVSASSSPASTLPRSADTRPTSEPANKSMTLRKSSSGTIVEGAYCVTQDALLPLAPGSVAILRFEGNPKPQTFIVNMRESSDAGETSVYLRPLGVDVHSLATHRMDISPDIAVVTLYSLHPGQPDTALITPFTVEFSSPTAPKPTPPATASPATAPASIANGVINPLAPGRVLNVSFENDPKPHTFIIQHCTPSKKGDGDYIYLRPIGAQIGSKFTHGIFFPLNGDTPSIYTIANDTVTKSKSPFTVNFLDRSPQIDLPLKPGSTVDFEDASGYSNIKQPIEKLTVNNGQYFFNDALVYVTEFTPPPPDQTSSAAQPSHARRPEPKITPHHYSNGNGTGERKSWLGRRVADFKHWVASLFTVKTAETPNIASGVNPFGATSKTNPLAH